MKDTKPTQAYKDYLKQQKDKAKKLKANRDMFNVPRGKGALD